MALQGLWGKLHLHEQLLKARFSEFRGARGGVKRHRLQENKMGVPPQFLLSLVGQKKELTPILISPTLGANGRADAILAAEKTEARM